MLQVALTYEALPKNRLIARRNLLLAVEHREGQHQVVLGFGVIRATVLYQLSEFVELQCLLAVGELAAARQMSLL